MIAGSKNRFEDQLKHVRITISKDNEAMNLQRIKEKVDSLIGLKEKDMAKKVVELVSTERLEHDF